MVSMASAFTCRSQMRMSDNGCSRRTAIQNALVPAIATLGGISPAVAAYIDPTVDTPKLTKRVYLDVKIGDEEPGRLVIGLYGEVMPKTTDNFEKLCEGDGYVGTTFYRVLSDFQISGGAIGDPSGNSGKSSFGAPFEPDNFNVKHTKAGLVSMVRDKTGGADSRFFIAIKDDSGWADDKFAAFGIVEEGMDLVKKIEKVDVRGPKNTPKVAVSIIGSGVLANQ